VACLPVTAHCELDEAVTYASALSERELRAFERDLPIAEEADALARARRDRLRDSSALAAALSDLLAARQRLPRVADDCMPAVHLPCAYGDDAPPGCAPATLFERSLQCANGNTRPWFGELTARLRGFAERELWGAARRTPLGPACQQRIVRYTPALDSRADAILRDGAVDQQ
jgi:hypothetical protein